MHALDAPVVVFVNTPFAPPFLENRARMGR